MIRRGILVLAVLAASVSTAGAYAARNGLQVQTLSNGNFMVMNRGGLSAASAWCAAGDYAMSVLGVRPDTPVWRISEPPRPRGASIEFSLSPEGAASSTGLATLGGDGSASILAAAARNLCIILDSPGFRQ